MPIMQEKLSSPYKNTSVLFCDGKIPCPEILPQSRQAGSDQGAFSQVSAICVLLPCAYLLQKYERQRLIAERYIIMYFSISLSSYKQRAEKLRPCICFLLEVSYAAFKYLLILFTETFFDTQQPLRSE